MGKARLFILAAIVVLAIIEYWYLYRPASSLPPPPASVPAVKQGTPGQVPIQQAPIQIVPVAPETR